MTDLEQKQGYIERRDSLALDRTVLANERTFLAYTRTALTFLVVGLTFIKYLDDNLTTVVGWIFMPLGVLTLVSGVISYVRMKNHTESAEAKIGAK